MSSRKKKSNEKNINLLAYNEKIISFNEDKAILYMGMTDTQSLFFRIITKDKDYYEGLFSLLENKNYIERYIEIDNAYGWLLDEITKIKYNKPESQIILYNEDDNHINYQRIININLDLKKDKKDIIIINNNEVMKLLNEFNKKYKTFITLCDPVITLYKKHINNQEFEQLCKFELNASIILFNNNNISDITPLKHANFKNLVKLHLSGNIIKDLCIFNFEKLSELNL